MMIRKGIYYLLFILLLSSCQFSSRKGSTPPLVSKELETIKEKGRITVITDYSSTDYFIYKGQPLGFQYEMLQQLADHLGVRLDVRVCRNPNESLELLCDGKADLIAQDLTITRHRQSFVDFTNPHMQAYQVLVQRKPDNWQKMSEKEIQTYLITNPIELKGKTVYVTRGSAYAERLKSMSEEIGGEIHVIEVDESMEQLIYLVSTGEIPYTVSDNIIAGVNSNYYPNVDVGTPLSLMQYKAWAVRKGSASLLQALNSWLSDFTQTPKYKEIYGRYFDNKRSATIVESDFYAINTGKISPYDRIIRKYSSQLGWDWRLLASMIYQESRFKNNVTSWAGACGLMQLMPSTAKQYGLEREASPSEQIKAGTEYIQYLNNLFSDISNPGERIKFVLAAYNIGPGHIIDARNLARKNGADPNRWDNNVARFLLSKADPKYYNDPVVKCGYCRGTETFRYVTEVLERYEHYKNLVEK